MPQSRPLSVGLEVHPESLAVASVATAPHAAGVSLGHMGTRPCASAQRLRQLPATSAPLLFVSAAGPCGSWLERSLPTKGQVGWGRAPSLRPTKPGDRLTTHRRAALTLARVRRSGDLPPGAVPQGEEAALRDLCRARAEALRARQAAPVRRNACLLRHASRSTGRATWGPAHLRWRSAVGWPTPAQHRGGQASRRAVHAPTARLARLAPARPAPGATWRRAPVVDARQAWRGVPCTGAVTTVAARGDLPRFDPPRQLRPSLGFSPSAYATGARRRQGGSTTTGHTPARRALLAGAWASRSPATLSRPLPRRLEKGPQALQDMRGQAPVRRGKRARQLRARGNHPHQGLGAIARARRACLGALAQAVPLTPATKPVSRLAGVRLRVSPSIG
jgi:transposase